MALSIRGRLTLWYTAIVLAILVVVSALAYSLLRWSVLQEVDASLLTVARVVAETGPASPDLDWERDVEALMRDFFGPELSRRFFRFLDPRGVPAASARARGGEPLPLTPTARANAARGETTFETLPREGRDDLRLVTLPILERGAVNGIVQVAAPLGRTERTLGRFRRSLLVLVPVGVGLAALGGFTLARTALRPVDEMTRDARRISAEDLARRLERHGTGDELDRLADTLNGMLDRLDGAFAQLRRFAADAAHELRTPLTVLRGHLEVALRAERSPAEYRRALATSLGEVEHLTRLAEDLLLLSRAAAGLPGPRGPVELEPLLRDVARDAAVLAAPGDITVEAAAPTPLAVLGDAGSLRRALLNLAENAVRYTPDGGRVTLALTREDGTASLAVSDTGPGIDPADAERVFQPFVRLETGRVRNPQGSGLGLAIARSIAVAHGGSLDLDRAPEGGARLTLRLPLA